MNRRAAELATETAYIPFQSFDRRERGDPINDYCAVDAVEFVCSLEIEKREEEKKTLKKLNSPIYHKCNRISLFVWMPNELIYH